MPRWLSFVSHEAPLDGFLALGGEHSCKQEVKLRGRPELHISVASSTKQIKQEELQETLLLKQLESFFSDLVCSLTLLRSPPPTIARQLCTEDPTAPLKFMDLCSTAGQRIPILKPSFESLQVSNLFPLGRTLGAHLNSRETH